MEFRIAKLKSRSQAFDPFDYAPRDYARDRQGSLGSMLTGGSFYVTQICTDIYKYSCEFEEG